MLCNANDILAEQEKLETRTKASVSTAVLTSPSLSQVLQYFMESNNFPHFHFIQSTCKQYRVYFTMTLYKFYFYSSSFWGGCKWRYDNTWLTMLP